MYREWFMFGMGLVVGGLSVTACWGLFWSAVGAAGLFRGTCGWRVLLSGLAVWIVPVMIACGLFWLLGEGDGIGEAFAIGMMGVPIVLVGLGLRQAPDGRRALTHMIEGAHHLMDEILGRHHACGGCGERHEH